MIREKIKAFYSEYNPEKLRTVDELMIKYKGRSDALYNTIKKNIDEAGRNAWISGSTSSAPSFVRSYRTF